MRKVLTVLIWWVVLSVPIALAVGRLLRRSRLADEARENAQALRIANLHRIAPRVCPDHPVRLSRDPRSL